MTHYGSTCLSKGRDNGRLFTDIQQSAWDIGRHLIKEIVLNYLTRQLQYHITNQDIFDVVNFSCEQINIFKASPASVHTKVLFMASLLEMLEEQRQEEPDDMIQVPLFDAVLTGGLSLGRLQPWGRREWGFKKKKRWVCGGIWGGAQSLALLGNCLRVQDVSQDNGR